MCMQMNEAVDSIGPSPSDAKVVWLTGLPASGKTTIARALHSRLSAAGKTVAVIDGDALRSGLCSDLGFSELDRTENIRRAGHVARLMADMGLYVVVAMITPRASDRESARQIVGRHRFLEVFVDAPVSVCIDRDPKGLYARAISGEIKTFTGISATYERPISPEMHLRTDQISVDEAVSRIVSDLLRL